MQIKVLYLTKGIREENTCDVALSTENNSTTLHLGTGRCTFSIVLSDRLELDDFIRLLEKNITKLDLYSQMQKDGKDYSGKKKFLMKSRLVVSQGGARIDFPEESRALLHDVLTTYRSKLH
ncbi:MAG: hypothetical protein HGA85_04665 [Nanoarchaeota archaeon]|nr:hypothetical protein [Nanoarchaeota archaeon]